MGVMPCHRKGCKNIMCDRYSEAHGTICDDCFNELVAVKTNNCNVLIEDFMNSEVNQGVVNQEAMLNQIFPRRDD